MNKHQQRYDAIAARLQPSNDAPVRQRTAGDDFADHHARFAVITAAAERGDIEELTRRYNALDRKRDSEETIKENLSHAMSQAAKQGRLDAVKHLHRLGGNLTSSTAINACTAGHGDILEYFLSAGSGFCKRHDATTCVVEASKGGHLHILKILHEAGHLSMDAARSALNNPIQPQPQALDIFKLLYATSIDESARDLQSPHILYPMTQEQHIKHCAEHAMANGATDILIYLHRDMGLDLTSLSRHAVLSAARSEDSLRLIRYLHENGASISEEALTDAVAKNRHETVLYLLEQGLHSPYSLRRALCLALTITTNPATAPALIRAGARMQADWRSLQFSGNAIDLFKTMREECGIDLAETPTPLFDLAIHAPDSAEALRYLLDSGVRENKPGDLLYLSIVRFASAPTVAFLMAEGLYTEEVAKRAFEYSIHQSPGDPIKRFAVAEAIRNRGINTKECGIDELDEPTDEWKPRFKQFKNYLLWNKMHGFAAQNFLNLSPHYFRSNPYADICGMLEKEGYAIDLDKTGYASEPAKMAYHTAGLFKTTGRVLDYLNRWGVPGKQPLHDLIYPITLPQQGRPNLSAWGDAVLRHGPKMARLVKFADKVTEPAKDSRGQWSYTKTLDLVAQSAYKRGAENPELARICFALHMKDEEFSDALNTVLRYQSKPRHRIPDIAIDGSLFDKPGYHFYKLNDGDPRGLLLGEFTNCCQHVGGAGAECAKHGFLSPEAGFYVIADDTDDKIIAQSWAWRGKNDELVFDSLESLNGHMNAGQWQKLCDVFATAAQNHTLSKISTLHIGKGGATPRLSYPVETAATPADYDGYRDSSRQYKIGGPA